MTIGNPKEETMTSILRPVIIGPVLVAMLLTVIALTLPRTAVPMPQIQAQEREGERTITQSQPRPTTTPQKTVAIVDDDSFAAETMTEFIISAFSGFEVVYYPNCEMLLAAMGSGVRHRLYIVDNQLDDFRKVTWGPVCTAKIIAFDSTAIVVGQSTDNVRDQFIRNGAKDFLLRKEGLGKAMEILRPFLQ